MDPHSLYADPDAGVVPNADPDSGLGPAELNVKKKSITSMKL